MSFSGDDFTIKDANNNSVYTMNSSALSMKGARTLLTAGKHPVLSMSHKVRPDPADSLDLARSSQIIIVRATFDSEMVHASSAHRCSHAIRCFCDLVIDSTGSEHSADPDSSALAYSSSISDGWHCAVLKVPLKVPACNKQLQ